MKKILLITNEFPPGPGGIGNQAYHLAVLFSKRGYEVSVYTASRVEFEDEIFDKNSLFKVSRYKANQNSLTKLMHCIRFLIKTAPSMDVFILSGSAQLTLTLLLTFYKKTKTICIIHGHELSMANGLFKFVLKSSLKISNRLIAVSEFSRQRIKREVSVPVEVIPNGIDIKAGGFKLAPKKILNSEPIRLVTVGSITKRKGQQNVIKAMPFILKYFPKLEYHVIGMPIEVNELKSLIRELNIVQHVVVHGVLTESEKLMILEKMDVSIMLSENLPNGDVEGFGIALLEGNLLGLPAIGAKGTGIEQAISDGRSGILVEADQPEQIANAVREIIESYEVFSIGAIQWATYHDWNIVGEKYIDIIEENLVSI